MTYVKMHSKVKGSTMTMSYKDRYNSAKSVYKERKGQLAHLGFREVKDSMYRHHAKKNYSGFVVATFSCWRKKLENRGYVHVILLCLLDDNDNPKVYIYTRGAFDPILYGLRNWYLDGGDADSDDVIEHVERMGHLTDADESFVRPRFRQGTVKAHVRAFFQMFKDMFSGLLSRR